MPEQQSIARRLTWMNVLVSAAALLLACSAFVTYDQLSYRQNLVRFVSSQAQIIGANSVSAVVFNDPQAATRTLAALATSRSITSAGIFTPDGRIFARYSRDGAEQVVAMPELRPGQMEVHWIRNGSLVLVQAMQLDGKTIGTVYIQAELSALTTRLFRYLGIALVVMLVSLGLAVVISARIRRSLADPIIGLSQAAREVSRDRNYSLRVPSRAEYAELSTLVEAFNDMLSQIEQRDDALRKAQQELEQRVEDRTRQLAAANRELEAFSYSVSHDLRNPLETINGFSHILLTEYGEKLDAAGREYLAQVQSATRRMAELIEDLLNLSRVNTMAMHRERCDLSKLARSIAADLGRRHPERKVEFVIADCPPADADARLLRIVLENLLWNSWKYTSGHGTARIEFGCRDDGERLAYFVRDDGAGFNQRDSARLFKPFQRLHSMADFPGTGIGLATVQRIVNRHGGEVWAEGEVEHGATFYFTIASETGYRQLRQWAG